MVFDTSSGGWRWQGGGSSVGLGSGGIGAGGRGGCRWSIVVNATIFLPILEGALVDANILLLHGIERPTIAPREQTGKEPNCI
jgi:hypothetical protein